MHTIFVRQADKADVPALCQMLNAIIEIGGTTAYEIPLTDAQFERSYLSDESCLSCFCASDSQGRTLGFQSLSRNAKLAQDWANIATYSAPHLNIRGVGTHLFDHTVDFARRNSISCINATIRADNVPGLGYYSKMGFVDYAVQAAVPLLDGTAVDRKSKKFVII